MGGDLLGVVTGAGSAGQVGKNFPGKKRTRGVGLEVVQVIAGLDLHKPSARSCGQLGGVEKYEARVADFIPPVG